MKTFNLTALIAAVLINALGLLALDALTLSASAHVAAHNVSVVTRHG